MTDYRNLHLEEKRWLMEREERRMPHDWVEEGFLFLIELAGLALGIWLAFKLWGFLGVALQFVKTRYHIG